MPLSIALSAFDIATVIASFGMAACLLAVLPHDADAAIGRRLRTMLGIALALLTLASFGILLSRTLELNGGAWATLWPDLRVALAVTHFGHVWLWRLPALALAWIGWRTLARHRHSGWLVLLAVAAIALTRSETGHPADHGDFTLAVWLDWLHLLAAGTWVGSLFGMSLAVFPKMRDDEPAMNARIFQRLSTLCGGALAVLVACGVYSAVQQLEHFNALWTTHYGMLLDVKLALVLAMIAIGAHNRYIKLPQLRTAAGTTDRHGNASIIRACARAVLLESLLGLAVIGATAALLHAMPPADAPMHSMAVMSTRAGSAIAAAAGAR